MGHKGTRRISLIVSSRSGDFVSVPVERKVSICILHIVQKLLQISQSQTARVKLYCYLFPIFCPSNILAKQQSPNYIEKGTNRRTCSLVTI